MELRALQGDTWTKRTACVGFPILVEYALQRREITYKEWKWEIVRRGLEDPVLEVQYGYPAGSIGDACLEYSKNAGVYVPPINLMVVNKKERIPGKGSYYYIKHFCRHFLERKFDPEQLDVQQKRAIIEQALKEIYDFKYWDNVLGDYGLSQARRVDSPR